MMAVSLLFAVCNPDPYPWEYLRAICENLSHPPGTMGATEGRKRRVYKRHR
jgi:hypothetical protein